MIVPVAGCSVGHELTSLSVLSGSSAVTGDSHCSWSVADVTELPPVGEMAARPRETTGEVSQAPP